MSAFLPSSEAKWINISMVDVQRLRVPKFSKQYYTPRTKSMVNFVRCSCGVGQDSQEHLSLLLS